MSYAASRVTLTMRDDHAGTVDTQMELLAAARATPVVFRGRPLAFAHHEKSLCCRRSSATVLWPRSCPPPPSATAPASRTSCGPGRRDWSASRSGSPGRSPPSGAKASGRRVGASGRSRSRDLRIAAAHRGDRSAERPTQPWRLGEPQRHIAPTDGGALVRAPIPHPILRLVRGVHARFQRTSMPRGPATRQRLAVGQPEELRSRAPTPSTSSIDHALAAAYANAARRAQEPCTNATPTLANTTGTP